LRILIFAGGSGRRLWPISRQHSPKQFEPVLGDHSTLELAVKRVEAAHGLENVYISTNLRYLDTVRALLPQLPESNLIAEPARRDLAPAVALALSHIAHRGQDEPVAILWGDSYMTNTENFLAVLAAAERLVADRRAEILFVGETPRFANQNLGWIGLGDYAGDVDGLPYYHYQSLTYRPPLDECERMFAGQRHTWNTGYFVTTPRFILGLYRRCQPLMWRKLEELAAAIGRPEYDETLQQVYPQMERISFDDAILTHVEPQQALVIHGEMGWSDPGTLYALKEAINPARQINATKGLVVDQGSEDCLLYNYENDKVLVAIGLEGMVIVNTEDALLVVHKDDIPFIKKVVNSFEGTEWEKYS
jgi:mannose-1-phosphate guanylyltransferase